MRAPADGSSERGDLVVAEVVLGSLHLFRQLQPLRRVAGSRPSSTASWRAPERTLATLRTSSGEGRQQEQQDELGQKITGLRADRDCDEGAVDGP